jgi:ribosome maturation factor RimP
MQKEVKYLANSKSKGNIAEKVDALLRSTVEELGYILWDVEYKKEGSDYNLILTIDKDGEVTMEDCISVTDAVNPILDEADPIPDSYCLEVSSAGLERELKKPEHLEKYLGTQVEVKLFAPLENVGKLFTETLVAFDNEEYTFGDIKVAKDKVASIKTVVDYADIFKNN